MSTAPVFVTLLGGLGNQLFQYAFGRALAQRLQVPLRLDARELRRRAQHRGLMLDALRIQAAEASVEELATFPRWQWKLSRALRRRHRPLFGIWHEAALAHDAAVASGVRPGQLVSGFWQSWRYFDGLAPALRQELQPRAAWSDAARQWFDRIASGPGPSVALHVRRGDYARHMDALARHGLCQPAYYAAALDALRQRLEGLRVFVFSDDPAWVRAQLPLGDGAHWVSGPALGPIDDLHLMAACDHQIIANSTFSWWGAWLNDKPGAQVVAPAPWFDQPGLDSADRYPAGWRLLHKQHGTPVQAGGAA